MASLWQRTLYYLGLVDEGDADEEVATATAAPRAPSQAEVRTVEPMPAALQRSRGDVPGRRVEPPLGSRRRMSDDAQHAEAGVYMMSGDERSGYGEARGESDVILARAFSDAQLLADSLKGGRPVVMDLRTTEPEMVRRLVDFSSGLTYALNGGMRKVAQGVILVSPPGVRQLSAEERERLASLGLYEIPED